MGVYNKYPYTDFHELNLDWFLEEFKKVTDQVTDLDSTVQEFTEFVTNYFDDLDVSEEINAKLEHMLEDGTLAQLLQPVVNEILAGMQQNITANNNRIDILSNQIGLNSAGITTLGARMDSFTSLTQGSTSGDAELADIRVGANGITYASAGAAVRGQITDVEENIKTNADFRIDNILNSERVAIIDGFKAGYTLGSSGQLLASNNRITTFNMVDVSPAIHLYITMVSGYEIYVALYDRAGTFMRRLNWSSSDQDITLATGEAFARFTIRDTTDAVVLTAADSDKATITYDTQFERDMLRSLTYRRNLSAGESLDDVVAIGHYGISQDLTITGKPSNFRGGSLFVFYGYSAGLRQQMLISAVSHQIWLRYRSSTNVWSAWNETSGFDYISNVATNDDLDNYIKLGYYNIPNNRVVLNKPSQFTGGTLLVVYGYTNGLYQQILISAVQGNIWIRYRGSSGAWSDWKSVAGFPQVAEKTKWLAIGDSIVYGVYSYTSDSSTATGITSNNWPRLVASALDFDLTVMASRGIGYVVTGQDPDDSSAPRIRLSELITRAEALTDEFNLITVNLGINDYNTQSASISEIQASLTDAITRLQTRWPNAQIIVFTPFNGALHGDQASRWSYDYEFGGRTLKDVSDAIKAACELNCTQCIDATLGIANNLVNMSVTNPDGVHPSLAGHKRIAKSLAKFIIS